MKKRGIGTVLQIEMEKQKVTAAELAEATRIPRQTIYSMLKKTTFQVDIINLKKISDYLEVDISIFFELEHYQKPITQDKEERDILSSYQKLNSSGKKKAQEYLIDLKGNPKYTKNPCYQALTEKASNDNLLSSINNRMASDVPPFLPAKNRIASEGPPSSSAIYRRASGDSMLSPGNNEMASDEKLLYPLNMVMLSTQIVQFVDLYLNRDLTESRLKKVVLFWENNVPELLYDNQDKKTISKGVLRHIGKNRAKVIIMVLRNKSIF